MNHFVFPDDPEGISIPQKIPENIYNSSDTIERDNFGRFMNQMTQTLYGFTLVTCPQCGSIIRYIEGEKNRCLNSECIFYKETFTNDECPDLFH